MLQLNLPEESEETFSFLDTIHGVVARYYPEGSLLVGNSTSDFDLSTSFGNDNMLISIPTIVFVILILVIQGSVWINFSLSDLYRVYIPSQMSLEIYSKLYLALLRSMQKEGTKLAVQQQNQNYRAIIMDKKDHWQIFSLTGG